MKTNVDVARAHDVCERLYLSVRQLAIGKGDVRERLAELSATLLPLRTEDFPTELQAEYDRISKRLTKYPARYINETVVEASCQRMRRNTGKFLAESIVMLYENAMRIQGNPLI